MSKFVRDSAVIALEAAADHSDKRGYLVALSAGKAAINASTTVAAFGVILDGEEQGGDDSVGVLGGNLGTVRLKAGGAISKGQLVTQKADGTVEADDAAGARVVVGKALEAADADELFEAIVFNPVVYAA